MLQVQEAKTRLLEHFQPGAIEDVSLDAAVGRVLAEKILAEADSPAFSQSAMDGVAIRCQDVVTAKPDRPVSLKLIGEIAAGDAQVLEVEAGEAALIMTGAPLPKGADAVVRVEDTNLDYTTEEIPEAVAIYEAAAQGENVRVQGENYSAGSEVLPIGHTLLPQDIGMLAMLGKSKFSVFKKPLVGLFSSGDELVEPGTSLAHGQIYNSNSHMLAALLRQAGAEVLELGIIRDTEKDILAALKKIHGLAADLILTSGGVSMGRYDYVRRVVQQQGRLDFWKVNMRPGKPLAFGNFKNIPFIGLPGNPVSSFVGAQVFVLPAIAKMLGKAQKSQIFSKAVLYEAIRSDGRESYLPGKFTAGVDSLQVRPVGNQSSGNLFALVKANCLIKIAPGVQSLRQDSVVEIWRFD